MEDVPLGNKIRARDSYDVLAPPGMSFEFLFVPGLLLTGAGVASEYSLRMSDGASWTRAEERTWGGSRVAVPFTDVLELPHWCLKLPYQLSML